MLQAEVYLIIAVETHQIRVGSMIKYVTSRLIDFKDFCEVTDDLHESFAFLSGEIQDRPAWNNPSAVDLLKDVKFGLRCFQTLICPLCGISGSLRYQMGHFSTRLKHVPCNSRLFFATLPSSQ